MSPVISHAEEGWDLAKRLGARLEAAETKLAEEQAYARQQKQLRAEAEAEVERLRESASRHVCESHTGCADLLAAKTAEIERLRCIISPGDAAAFEEHMATREAHWVAQVERLREMIGVALHVPNWREILQRALRGGGE